MVGEWAVLPELNSLERHGQTVHLEPKVMRVLVTLAEHPGQDTSLDHGFDSIFVGYYKAKDLMYVARTRNGFVPASRREVFSKLKHLVTSECPFVNLPETKKSRF